MNITVIATTAGIAELAAAAAAIAILATTATTAATAALESASIGRAAVCNGNTAPDTTRGAGATASAAVINAAQLTPSLTAERAVRDVCRYVIGQL
jgi:hypothetical protein